MEVSETDLLALLRTIDILKPYLGEIVIVGGWVPFIYRRYGSMPTRHPAVRTTDIDIAVPRKLAAGKRQTINDLLRKAGYQVRMYGSDTSVMKYEMNSPATEIEFLTPEAGGRGEKTISVQRDLSAQALRYLQILLEHTKNIDIDDTVSGYDVRLVARVPSPGAFVYQKGLTLDRRRSRSGTAKDLYYIFDVLDSSAQLRDSIPADIASVASHYAAGWFRAFMRNIRRYFPESGGEGIALIATQYTGSIPADAFRNYVQGVFSEFIRALDKATKH